MVNSLNSTTDYTDDTDYKMIHEELSGEIIGAAMSVLNELKPGLDERLYERAMIIELKHRGHIISVQSSFPVHYRGELIGNLIPDLIVDKLCHRRSKSSRVFYGHACGADDWISKHHEFEPSHSDQFQECAIGMETCVASATDGTGQSA